MVWKNLVFERSKLFDAAWDTPISKLAKEFGLSDVGLRKVCFAMEIPLPPRGYWAKLAAGKRITRPQLKPTAGRTSYTIPRFEAPVDEPLEARIAEARALSPPPDIATNSDYPPTRAPQDFLPQTKIVVKAMKHAKFEDGAHRISGTSWADIAVSKGQIDRTLLLVDRLAYELEKLGAEFDNSQPAQTEMQRGARHNSVKRNGFAIHGHQFFIRIREKITAELAPSPENRHSPKGPKTQQTSGQIRSAGIHYVPTEQMQVSIVEIPNYYERYKIQDSARGTVETKILRTLQAVENAAFRWNVTNQVRAEREQERKKKAQEWELAKANKDVQLAHLAKFEAMAKDLDRARSLRRLIDEIKSTPTAPTELLANVELMEMMANWIDPLVKSVWPEVDSIGERNPYGSHW